MDGKLDAKTQSALRKRMAELARDDGKKSRPGMSFKQKKLANKFSLLATEGALQGVGSQLQDYASDDPVVRLPLQPYERRWFEPMCRTWDGCICNSSRPMARASGSCSSNGGPADTMYW